jgi:hypothetical protein
LQSAGNKNKKEMSALEDKIACNFSIVIMVRDAEPE